MPNVPVLPPIVEGNRAAAAVLRPRVLGGSAVLIVVLALVALVTAPPTPVTEDAALAAFREQLAADAEAGDGATSAPSDTAAPTEQPTAAASEQPSEAASTDDAAPDASSGEADSDSDSDAGADTVADAGTTTSKPSPKPSPSPTTKAEAATSYARPAQGVYRFRVEGGESLDVPGGSRTYPSEATATVLHRGAGCGWTSRTKLAEEHEDEFEFCTDSNGHAMRGVESYVEFLGQGERQNFTCSPALALPEAKTDPASSVSCNDVKAGIEARITVRATGHGTRTVGGVAVDGVRLLYDVRFTGNSEGTSTIETWVTRSSGALLSLDRKTDTMVQSSAGRRHYQEQVTMELLSVTPRS